MVFLLERMSSYVMSSPLSEKRDEIQTSTSAESTGLPVEQRFNRDTLQRSQNLKSFTIYTINKYRKKGAVPQGSE